MSTFRNVTPDEIRLAMKATGKRWFPLRDCSICGADIGYIMDGDQVAFDPSCGCSSAYGPEPRSFADICETINMQTNLSARINVASKFGLDLSGEQS